MKNEKRLAPLPPLGSAVAATAWVLGAPLLAFALVRSSVEPSPAAAGAVTLAASIAAAGAVTLWIRARHTAGAGSVGDLLLWSWYRRLHARRTLEEGEELLVDAAVEEADTQLLESLAGALEILDPYTHGHSRRVEHHVRRTAVELEPDFDAESLDRLSRAAALHDVGKMHVPDSVLGKHGPLTDEERALMQTHVTVGAELLNRVGEPSIAAAVLHHHESWDGSGYPSGLAGEEIPFFARVIAVADAYDAMVSARPYRASLGRDEALRILEQEAGRQFDPRVVRAFLRVLPATQRVPLLLPLAGWFHRVAKDAISWARRTGASTLAPTVGSYAAAAVLSTALISSPSVPDLLRTPVPSRPPSSSSPTIVAPAPRATTTGREVTAVAVRDGRARGEAGATQWAVGESAATVPEAPAPGDPADLGPGGEDPGEPGGGGDPGGGGGEVPGGEVPGGEVPGGGDPGGGDPGGGGEDPGGGSGGDGPGSGGDGGVDDPGGGGGDPGTGGDPGVDDPGGGGGGSTPDGDPQPGKGKDCEVPPPSPGNDKHCSP